MKWIEWSIERPVSTIVGVLLLAVFGGVAIMRLPIQMKPTMDRPIIQIQTIYPGAAPPEVEEQITNKLEERVNSVEGLRKLSSVSMDSYSSITLEFEWGVDRDARFVDVLQKVNEVEDFPIEIEKPIITASSSGEEEPIMWIMLQSETLSVEEMSRFATKEIKDSLARVEGVADVKMYGKREREISIVLDPEAIIVRGLTVSMVRQAILQENQNLRGGYLDEGKTRFNVRTIGEFKAVEAIKNLIVARTPNGIVYLSDIAEVKDYFQRIDSVVRGDAKPMVAIGVARKQGANVIDVTKKVEEVLSRLNKRFSKISYQGREAGLLLTPAYRESDYIWDSLNFVYQNLAIGSLLAVISLLLFLKSLRSTFIVSIVIPVCFISIFIFLHAFDRTINIISLAGIAFAIGMTVDNAIVVIENIYRHMEMGKNRREAALEGTTEVWGAVLASTLTTVAVFLPVVYIKDEAGELFKDIGITIAISVSLSMVLSITVIPMFSARLLKLPEKKSWSNKTVAFVFFLPDWIGRTFSFLFGTLSNLVTGKYFERIKPFSLRFLCNLSTKIGITVAVAFFSILLVLRYAPPMEYLPSGNQNLIIVIYKPHTGLNIHKGSSISLGMEQKIMGLLFDDAQGDKPENRVVERMFSVVSSQFNVIGVILKKEFALRLPHGLPMSVNPMTNRPFSSTVDYIAFKINTVTFGTPGTEYAFAIKPSLFNYRGKGFDIEVRGPEVKKLEEITAAFEAKLQPLGNSLGRVTKDYETGLPEIRVEVDREKAAALGLTSYEIGEVVETLIAGRKTGKFREGSEEIDIVVKGTENLLANLENLKQTSFIIPGKGHTTLETVANIYLSTGPTQIRHKERLRAITLTANLPEEKPLEEAIEEVSAIVKEMRKDLPGEYSIEISGSASDMERTGKAFAGSAILAVIITYLLMASLFESFLYPLLIMITVPLAVLGGILGISLNAVPMDMLTVLGFIILCGIVVNNAILVVHQSLNFRKYGMEEQESIRKSVSSRLRPIFMSTLTTVLGIFPMCIKGSPGSELYSGLGTAIVGGLLFSTLFTLVLIPAMLSTLADIKEFARNVMKKKS